MPPPYLTWTSRITLSVILVISTVTYRGSAARPDISDGAALQERLLDFIEFEQPEEAISDVRDMEALGLMSGATDNSVWSGDYWPLRFGGISAPFKNGYKTGLLGKISWEQNRKRFDRRWKKLDPRNLSPSELAKLAPAEKLDLLLSNYDLPLTNNVWDSIEEHLNRVKKIKKWEGICHGWSTAAIGAPRPVQTVWAKSADGRYTIPFHPDDLKGLTSWMYANSLVQDYTKTAGRRCTNKKRKFDPVTGLSNDPSCNGVDPELFHLALVNLMGVKKKTFVINKNNDVKIWNQPLKSYRFKWFNVETGREGSLASSVTPFDRLSSNIRGDKRSADTRYLVGVLTRIDYVKETKPSRSSTDTPSHDKIKKLEYIYDLELDENYRVIGGEWRNFRTDQESIRAAEEDDHPDFPGFPGFIWRLQSHARAVSIDVDLSKTETWNVGDPIPASFQERARKAARFRYMIFDWDKDGNPVLDEQKFQKVRLRELRPQPLSVVVDGLLRAAKARDDSRNP